MKGEYRRSKVAERDHTIAIASEVVVFLRELENAFTPKI